jgi:hypothetical protein
MVKISPFRNSFNAGEFSILTEGRVDTERYPASMRSMLNCIAAPQGPAIGRSGTKFIARAKSNSSYSALIPFTYDEDQTIRLEFSANSIRFINEDGPQTFAAVAITVVLQANPLKFTAAGHGLSVGDDTFLSGLPLDTNGNNQTVNVTAVAGNDITVSFAYNGAVGAVAANSNKIYQIATVYTSDDVRNIRYLQKDDVTYLYCPGKRNYKLSRLGATNWTISEVVYANGPFMPAPKKSGRLAISANGGPTPDMTSDVLPTGVCSASTAAASREAFRAFDRDRQSWWEPTTVQQGWLQYQFPTAKVVDGYTIYVAKQGTSGTVSGESGNADADYTAKDHAPGSWTFSGSTDGTTWAILDQQDGYVLYDNNRSVLFPVNNDQAYAYYRLDITECVRNGPIKPRVGEFVLSASTDPSTTINVVLSGTYDDINSGAGFKVTDIGRLLRMKGRDNNWRVLKITAFTDATHVQVKVLDSPFLSIDPILDWQMGYWSDTTGWPTCGILWGDRIFVAGISRFPRLVCASGVGNYEDFGSTTSADVVTDALALVLNLNTKIPSPIRWLASDERGILVGTGSGEHIIQRVSTQQVFGARNVESIPTSRRGSANMEPVQVDRQILFVQTAKRTLRELAYVYEADGYKAPSMSLFASHLGVPNFAQIVYAPEPHNLAWIRRTDGSMVGLTYNREENVIGWHRHDYGGEVESICTTLSPGDKQDALWLVIKRTINGEDVRFIERLEHFWDFGTDISDAYYVDCGLVYNGAATDKIYGFGHLAGDTVDGLVNGIPYFGMEVSENGVVTMPLDDVTSFVGGKSYTISGEISRIEGGSQNGTSQGKRKRIGNIVAHLWDSYYGEIGTLNEDTQEVVWSDIRYDEPLDQLEPIALQTGMFGPMTEDAGFCRGGTIYFRQTSMLPFNLISLMPTMETQEP